jgi:hypothetical protein
MQRAAWLRARSGVRLILRCSFVDDAFVAGAAIQIKRIFNLTDNPIFGKKYRQFFRRTNRLHYLSFSVRSHLGKPIEYRLSTVNYAPALGQTILNETIWLNKINMIAACFVLAQRSNPGAASRGPWGCFVASLLAMTASALLVQTIQ